MILASQVHMAIPSLLLVIIVIATSQLLVVTTAVAFMTHGGWEMTISEPSSVAIPLTINAGLQRKATTELPSDAGSLYQGIS